MVGQHQERLVAHDRLVAVLRARAGDQQDHGKGAVALRPSEGAGEPGGAALVAHGLLDIGVGTLGVLRAAHPNPLVGTLQREGERGAALCEDAREGLAVRAQCSLIGDRQPLDREAHRPVGDPHLVHRHVENALIEAVHGAPQGAIGGLGNGEAEPQLDRPGLEGAIPEPLYAHLGRGRGDGGQTNQHRPKHDRDATAHGGCAERRIAVGCGQVGFDRPYSSAHGDPSKRTEASPE